MALSLRQIEVVRAVMRAGSVTEAARHLGVSQPAISRVLKHAEDGLGLVLFERRGGRLHPSPELRSLAPELERIFEEVSFVQRAAEDLRSLRGGRLTIAAIPSIAATVLADAIGRFVGGRPALALQVRTALNFEVPELMLARHAELGFAFDVRSHPELTRLEISRTPLTCIVPPEHELGARRRIDVSMLRGRPLISFSRSLAIGEAIESAFAEAGELQRIAIEVGQSFIACALVRAGAGIAVVDGLMARQAKAAGLVARPLSPRREIALHAVTRRSERLSLAASELLAVLTPART